MSRSAATTNNAGSQTISSSHSIRVTRFSCSAENWAGTLERILAEVSQDAAPPAVLRSALRGWLGYVDAAVLDWIEHGDPAIEQLRDLIIAAFVAALLAAAQADPSIQLRLE